MVIRFFCITRGARASHTGGPAARPCCLAASPRRGAGRRRSGCPTRLSTYGRLRGDCASTPRLNQAIWRLRAFSGGVVRAPPRVASTMRSCGFQMHSMVRPTRRRIRATRGRAGAPIIRAAGRAPLPLHLRGLAAPLASGAFRPRRRAVSESLRPRPPSAGHIIGRRRERPALVFWTRSARRGIAAPYGERGAPGIAQPGRVLPARGRPLFGPGENVPPNACGRGIRRGPCPRAAA